MSFQPAVWTLTLVPSGQPGAWHLIRADRGPCDGSWLRSVARLRLTLQSWWTTNTPPSPVQLCGRELLAGQRSLCRLDVLGRGYGPATQSTSCNPKIMTTDGAGLDHGPWSLAVGCFAGGQKPSKFRFMRPNAWLVSTPAGSNGSPSVEVCKQGKPETTLQLHLGEGLAGSVLTAGPVGQDGLTICHQSSAHRSSWRRTR